MSRNVFRILALAVAIWMAIIAQSHAKAAQASQHQQQQPHAIQR